MSRTLLHCIAAVVVSAVSCVVFVPNANAQGRTNVGRGKCVDCHDHKDEKEWSEKRDGDGKSKQHFNALNQLNDPRAPALAKAIGVADPYDVKSTCVKCHATVVRGEASDGVTCESCHGPGSQYLVPHQNKGSYQASIPLGMKDVVKKPQAWVRDCVTCHVLGANPGDRELAAAGHPTGDDFDVARKYVPVALHYVTKYTANEVAAAAGNIRTELLAKLKGGSAPAPPPTPAPAPPAAPAVATPAAAPTPAAGGTPPAPTAAAPKVAAAPPVAAPPPRPVTVPPPGLPSPRPPVAVPTPPPAVATTTETTVVEPAAPVAAPEPSLPTTPTGIVAAVQGRVAALLDRLLASGVRTPSRVTPPERKTVYRGPDADLLRLQEEVIALALEALGSAPAPKTPPQPQQ